MGSTSCSAQDKEDVIKTAFTESEYHPNKMGKLIHDLDILAYDVVKIIIELFNKSVQLNRARYRAHALYSLFLEIECGR